jgi:hypothetical protein
MNRGAENVLRREDGLLVRQGKLCAQRIFDHEKLPRAIAVAANWKLRPRSHACSWEGAMVGCPIF